MCNQLERSASYEGGDSSKQEFIWRVTLPTGFCHETLVSNDERSAPSANQTPGRHLCQAHAAGPSGEEALNKSLSTTAGVEKVACRRCQRLAKSL